MQWGRLCGVVVLLAVAARGVSGTLDVIFEPESVRQLKEMENATVVVWSNDSLSHLSLCAFSTEYRVAHIVQDPLEFKLTVDGEYSIYKSSFTIFGKFLGYSKVYLRNCSLPEDVKGEPDEALTSKMFVSVIRVDNGMDNIFIVINFTLLFFLYINFGCALNVPVIIQTLKKPIGITIGLVSQFVFMPLMSFGIARILFPDQPALQLGLFFVGCSPGGAASNIWTLILKGNLDLSVTMTAVSTFASFLTIPFWVFTLGNVIFADARIGVPYQKIGVTALSLFIPLIIGIFFQFKLPRVAKFMVKILKPFAGLMLAFFVFASYSNLFLFKFMDWKLFVATCSNPLLGYLFGAGVSTLFRQSKSDVIAISIETGIQNGAIALLLLKTALEPPECDISAVVPVNIFISTQIPLLLLLVIFKIRDCTRSKKENAQQDDPEVEVPLKEKPAKAQKK